LNLDYGMFLAGKEMMALAFTTVPIIGDVLVI
jgi:hypothetical protein